MEPPSTPTQPQRLSLSVAIEAGADGRLPVHQVFPDGSFTAAENSHFERTSAIASAFVARALAAPPPPSSIETRATDTDLSARWANTVVTEVEGALYEIGRAISVVEALRASEPMLELRRNAAKVADRTREGGAMLMARKRALTRSADILADRVGALSKWVDNDNAFCEAFLMLRRKCNGLRRAANGTPLIDVGDGHFAPVLRQREASTVGVEAVSGDAAALRIVFPATTYLHFGINHVGDEYCTTAAPVVLDSGNNDSLKAVIRKIRLSRVSAFRRKTFECVAGEASNVPVTSEMTTNSIGIESGPYDFLRICKTQRDGTAPSLDDALIEYSSDTQDASLLQIICTHACLTQTTAHDQPGQLLDRVLAATTTRSVLQATEEVLDEAVKMLRVRLEWTRGSTRAEEARVRVYSCEADGDGPERALATIEPVTNINNGGDQRNNGHVRITPAFGVIIPAPDDPSARGRAVPPQSSSNYGSAPGLDDVPRSYVCPVGGEIVSVLTLLLCIRLLDALETGARAGVEEMLDVDRQCFTVIAKSPSTGRTLKAKVWPRGDTVGSEVPGATAWLDGQRVEDFPAVGPGRVKAWRGLLRRLVGEVAEPVDVGMSTPGQPADVDMSDLPQPHHMQDVAGATGGGSRIASAATAGVAHAMAGMEAAAQAAAKAAASSAFSFEKGDEGDYHF